MEPCCIGATAHIAIADDPDPARRWVRRSRGALQPWGTGSVYQSIPDVELEDPGLAYYGANLARLREIKARYDPQGFFPSFR